MIQKLERVSLNEKLLATQQIFPVKEDGKMQAIFMSKTHEKLRLLLTNKFDHFSLTRNESCSAKQWASIWAEAVLTDDDRITLCEIKNAGTLSKENKDSATSIGDIEIYVQLRFQYFKGAVYKDCCDCGCYKLKNAKIQWTHLSHGLVTFGIFFDEAKFITL